MNMANLEERECLALAIQTVLHNHRNRIHLFMDSRKNSEFIEELSEEIMRRADRYKKFQRSLHLNTIYNQE